MKSLAVLLLLAATAHAETAEQLTQTARNVARDGRCEALPAIGDRVRAIDPEYYARVYALDPVIAGCAHLDARLQAGGPPGMTALRTVEPAPPVPVGSPKSPATAVWMSLGVTAGGLGLAALGGNLRVPAISTAGSLAFVIGPTTGHIYAGHTANAGLAARGIGALAGFVGAILIVSCIDGCSNNNGDLGAGLFIGGGLLYVGGAIYEIADSADAVHRYNREHGFEANVVPTGNGVALVGRF
ncbi:MAG: hypothetical protein JO257_14515 [Deltaproteobacteria bacterium]|nr:hypothetical protein [Deltaproteobacteria bacterium]